MIAPRLAAATLVVRAGASGIEVLLLKRSARASFMPGAYVFPGGALDPQDANALDVALCDERIDAMQRRFGGDAAAALAVAALRECFEESGLWLGLSSAPGQNMDAIRRELHGGSITFEMACRSAGLRLHTSALHPWSRWITPPGFPKRFDAQFFVARAPVAQEATVDGAESVDLAWLPPEEALRRHALGGLPLEFPTIRMLEELQGFCRVDDLFSRVPASGAPIMPRRVASHPEGRPVVLPGDHAYAEISRLDPNGIGNAHASIVPGRVTRLSPVVWRITAPNAGVMTGPGTNTYLVGRHGRAVVIDPGPDIPAHLAALRADGMPAIEAIAVTHTHLDHSPAAGVLAAMLKVPVFGMPAPEQGRQDRTVVVDNPVEDNALVGLGGVELRAIHTQGHASNHVCWWLEEERILFSGDHVMQGSTVVIDPPDGDMADYLESLTALPVRLPTMEWLAPGHGFLMGAPEKAIAGLIRHRRDREAKVLSALCAGGAQALQQLLPLVYADVPVSRHPIARRSLEAHLIKLAAEGKACRVDERWAPCRTG